MSKKRIFASLGLLLFAPFCAGQDAPSFYADDFLNQSVIVVQGGRGSQQCQAVRISPKWYLTAAHCVRPYCDKECSLTFNLLPGDLQASATVFHSSADQLVFVPRQYRPGNGKNIRYDIALVRFDPAEEDYFFYDARGKRALDAEMFLKTLKNSAYSEQRRQWEALQKARPKLIGVTNVYNRRVARELAVPDLRREGIYFRSSGANPFYYFTQLRHYMGANFGVEKGMSGSGVILPGGDIIGVVSASLSGENKLVLYDENDQPVSTVPYSLDYFMFTPLSRENVNFIRATVNSFRDGAAAPRFVNVSGRYAEQTDQTLQSAFPELPPAQDITSAKEKK